MKCFLLLLVALGICVSCTSSYKKASAFNSEGFIDFRLGRDAFKITYNGGAFTNLETAVDFCLLRCAEISLDRGYSYFRVTRDSAGISRYIIKNPDLVGTLDGYPVRISGGYSEDIPRAVATNTIVCRNDVPHKTSDFLNARKIQQFIKKKYSN